MKKFISSFINLLINVVVIAFLLIICFIVFIFFISKSNDIAIENSIAYIKSFGNEISSSTLMDTEPINITLSDTTESTLTTTSTNIKYYYNQLDNTEKIIYDALEQNIDNLKKKNYTINFSTKFNDLLNQSDGQYKFNKAFQSAIDAFFYDHPELFYIDLSKISLLIKSVSVGPLTTYTVLIEPQNGNNYLSDGFNSEYEVNNAIIKVENIRNNIIKKLSNDSDYNKALKVHDILVDSIEYSSSSSKANAHNIYGALVENDVVCEGYAKAFKYILDAIGIDCILVSGNATNSSGVTESHMWNYIKLGDNWYGVDVTWDDPIVIGNYNSNIIRHDYFCKGSNVFNQDHLIINKISDNGKIFTVPELSRKNYK